MPILTRGTDTIDAQGIIRAERPADDGIPRRFPPPLSIEEIGAAFRPEGQRQPKAWLFLLRGRPRPVLVSKATQQGRGGADRGQRGEAPELLRKG